MVNCFKNVHCFVGRRVQTNRKWPLFFFGCKEAAQQDAFWHLKPWAKIQKKNSAFFSFPFLEILALAVFSTWLYLSCPKQSSPLTYGSLLRKVLRLYLTARFSDISFLTQHTISSASDRVLYVVSNHKARGHENRAFENRRSLTRKRREPNC